MNFNYQMILLLWDIAEDQGRASRTGAILYCFGCAVNWISKKQSLIALSSTEAEYIALSECIRDGLAYRIFYRNFPLETLQSMSIKIISQQYVLQQIQNKTY